jgi:opacity protein-like surface antigen
MRRNSLLVIATLAAALAVASAAMAAKGASSLSVVVVGPSTNAATVQPSYGGQITFDVSTNETDRPYVNVRCYQGVAFIYDSWQGFWTGYYTDPVFTLSSGYWTSGAADCTARLVYFDKLGRERTLASTSFHVNG